MRKTQKTNKKEAIFRQAQHIDYKISLYDYHPNHDQHMCNVVKLRNMKTAAELAKDAQYICFLCGRAAKKKENLCEPVAIEQ